MRDPRQLVPSRSARRRCTIGFVVGVATWLAGHLLTAGWLALFTGGSVGSLSAATTLTAGHAVPDTTVVSWVYYGAQYVDVTVQGLPRSTATRDLVDGIVPHGNAFAYVRATAMLLFVAGGAGAAAVARRVEGVTVRPRTGALLVVGYLPASLVALVATDVRLAPLVGDGKEVVGNAITSAGALDSAVVGLAPTSLVVVAVVYPVVFGAVGSWLTTIPGWIRQTARLVRGLPG